ncbi:hypothetical protein EC991_008333 [Linnemannia zychae]|nr:hypothetical protein EC991_008333 [Linnemannia zychae]
MSSHTLEEPVTSNLLELDDNKDAAIEMIVVEHDASPPSSEKHNTSYTSFIDSNQEQDLVEYDFATMPGIQHRRPKAGSLIPVVHDFPLLESDSEQENETAKTIKIGIEIHTELKATAFSVEPNKFHSWSVSAERIAMGAIQCLTESKDMELSYVSLLTAITVLNSRYEEGEGGENAVAEMKENGVVLPGTEDSVGRRYAELLGAMTKAEVAEGLEKETLRQGVISPGTLYIRLYNAVLKAGYQLQDDDHVRLGQFFFERQNTEDALNCLAKIESTRWTSAIYRLAISCHLYSTPRHLHEAEILLDQYLAHNKAQSSSFPSSSSSSSIRPRRGSRSSRDQDREQFNKSLIQTWFKQQLDASKWDEIKAQYERRRARLLDAPSNIERFSASMLIERDHSTSTGGGVSSVLEHKRGGSSVSRASNMADHGSVASGSSESLATGGTGITSNSTAVPVETPVAPPKRSSFSLFSAFRSSKPTSTISPSPIPTIQTRPAHDIHKQQPSASASNVQVNRHLTILDNGMLEECVNHKQFEYGWSIYERMGPPLEDKDTAKIAMRLCKRAFLGHGGLGPNLPGSPSVLAKDVYFGDEVEASQTEANERCEQAPRKGLGGLERRAVQEDPEIWEARSWVIYNKAMTNPFFLNSTSSPSNSPTQTQSPGVSANGVSGALTSPVMSMAGTTALSVFLHNILTIAINSQEKSSRYLKAFRIYSAMRNDPLNHYQSQLRDPFVMTCVIKAIYDTVLILVRAQDQERLLQQKQQQQQQQSTVGQQRRVPVSSLAPCQQQQQQHQPQMTIGPLIDLAFEIYADMRNVGPIRHLPRLSALAPSTPAPKTPQAACQASNSTAAASGGISSSMSIFFQLSSRTLASDSTAVDLSACGVTASSGLAAIPSTSTILPSNTLTSKTTFAPPSSSPPSSNNNTPPCILQDLNPTFFQPNIQARRLPSELYLALLHLCIQVPLSGVSVSSQIVKTIVADMVSSRPGQQPANLDRHLAAGLQVFHDRWMCRTVELKGRRRCQSISGRGRDLEQNEVSGGGGGGGSGECKEGEEDLEEVDLEAESDSEQDDSTDNDEVEEGGCIFHGWMYRPEEYVRKHMDLSSTSPSSSSSDLIPGTTNNNNTTIEADETTSSPTDNENSRDSPFEVAKYDEDLDELDRYLDEKKAGYFDSRSLKNTSNIVPAGDRKEEREGGIISNEASSAWIDELDHDTCNGRLYWDMWSREDPVLQEIRFSRRRARMLWRHVAEL